MIVCWFVTMDTRRVASRWTVAGASGTRDRPARAGTSCSKVIVAIPPFYIPCFWAEVSKQRLTPDPSHQNACILGCGYMSHV